MLQAKCDLVVVVDAWVVDLDDLLPIFNFKLMRHFSGRQTQPMFAFFQRFEGL